MVNTPNSDYPTYPNYDFLQLEEVNQTIYNFTKNGFYDVAEINTDEILKKFPSWGNGKEFIKQFNNLRYDFSLINLEFKGGIFTWTFKIVNILWTGKWTLLNTDRSNYTKEVYSLTPNKNGDTLILQGRDLYNFILRLEMSNDNVSRNILVDNYSFEGTYEYTHQFDSKITEYAILKDLKRNKYIDGATVKFMPLNDVGEKITANDGDWLQECEGINVRNGRYAINYSKVNNIGDYYGRLEAYVSGVLVAQTHVTVHKIQKYKREVPAKPLPQPVSTPSEPEVVLDNLNNLWIYKGSIKKFKLKISTHNDYNYSINKNKADAVVNIYHTYDVANNNPLEISKIQKIKTDVISTHADENGYFEFELNTRNCYVDKSYLTISLDKTDTFPAWTSPKYEIQHRWRYASDWLDLKTECEDERGADVIILNNKTYTATKENPTIRIGRNSSNKQYIFGEKGTGWSTLDEHNYNNCFRLLNKGSNKNFLYLRGIKITNSECAIYQENNTYLDIVACVFTENKHVKQNYQGGCVYQAEVNTLLNVDHSYFENNYANCILGRGNVVLTNNLFKITDVEHTYQPEPFVLEQYSGEGILKNNQLYVNTSMVWDSNGRVSVKRYDKNRSYAKISIWVGNKARVNGKTRQQLTSDYSMNFFDPPYNNRAYIFSCYYYPYGNVRTYIVASTPNHRINKGTGHAVYGTNWAFKDGYTLVRESSKSYNTNNPFVKFVNGKKIVSPQITVPTSGGVW